MEFKGMCKIKHDQEMLGQEAFFEEKHTKIKDQLKKYVRIVVIVKLY